MNNPREIYFEAHAPERDGMRLQVWKCTTVSAAELCLYGKYGTYIAAIVSKRRLRALAHAILKAIGDE